MENCHDSLKPVEKGDTRNFKLLVDLPKNRVLDNIFLMSYFLLVLFGIIYYYFPSRSLSIHDDIILKTEENEDNSIAKFTFQSLSRLSTTLNANMTCPSIISFEANIKLSCMHKGQIRGESTIPVIISQFTHLLRVGTSGFTDIEMDIIANRYVPENRCDLLWETNNPSYVICSNILDVVVSASLLAYYFKIFLSRLSSASEMSIEAKIDFLLVMSLILSRDPLRIFTNVRLLNFIIHNISIPTNVFMVLLYFSTVLPYDKFKKSVISSIVFYVIIGIFTLHANPNDIPFFNEICFAAAFVCIGMMLLYSYYINYNLNRTKHYAIMVASFIVGYLMVLFAKNRVANFGSIVENAPSSFFSTFVYMAISLHMSPTRRLKKLLNQ